MNQQLPFDFIEDGYEKHMWPFEPKAREAQFEDPTSITLSKLEYGIEFVHRYELYLDILRREKQQSTEIYEDELSKTLSELEASIEGRIVPAPETVLPLPESAQLKAPVLGLFDYPNSRLMGNSGSYGFQPPRTSTRLRPSRAGIRGISNDSDTDEIFCEKEDTFVTKEECKECSYWDNSFEKCTWSEPHEKE